MSILRNLTRRQDRGFTLIELLVVIAIIGVLAALVLAALSSAQKGSRDARRKSDLNQYKTALAQYNADNNGYPTQATSTAITGNTTRPCNATGWANYMTATGNCLTDTNGQQYFYIGSATQFGVCANLERKSGTRFEVGPTASAETVAAASACGLLN